MLSVPVYTSEDEKWDLQDALTSVEEQYYGIQNEDDNEEADNFSPQ